MKIRIASISLILCLALGVPASAAILYDNGPTNGSANALFIDGPGAGPFSQTISNGFVATGTGIATSLDFGVWVTSGLTPTTVSWALGTSAFGSEISSGSTPQVGFAFFGANGFGYDVYTATVGGLSGLLSSGSTYYLTLGGANDSANSQFVAWDVNLGPTTCSFAVSGSPVGDCGAGGGNSFTIFSDSNSAVPEPASIVLFGSGMLCLAALRRRRLSR
ncbi:MAG: PEP-CTERM sorting domain-containing protein [Acidobacteriota bacterium]